MEMMIDFPGGVRVDAHFGSFTVQTDQPRQGSGGEASAPTPFTTFLAALGTCAGFYVLSFCQRRGIATDGLRLVQQTETDVDTGMVCQVRLRHRAATRFSRTISGGSDSCRRAVRGEEAA